MASRTPKAGCPECSDGNCIALSAPVLWERGRACGLAFLQVAIQVEAVVRLQALGRAALPCARSPATPVCHEPQPCASTSPYGWAPSAPPPKPKSSSSPNSPSAMAGTARPRAGRAAGGRGGGRGAAAGGRRWRGGGGARQWRLRPLPPPAPPVLSTATGSGIRSCHWLPSVLAPPPPRPSWDIHARYMYILHTCTHRHIHTIHKPIHIYV